MNVNIQPALVRERFYPRSRQTVRTAREFLGETLDAWEVTGRRDDLLLCVSELATNALLHGVPPGRGYRLRLLRFEGAVRIEVHDSGGGRPGSRTGTCAWRGPGAAAGRGARGPVGVVPCVPGKVVWCEYDT